MEVKAHQLHAQGAKLREQGQYKNSVLKDIEALFAYDAEADDAGFAEGLADITITLRNYTVEHDGRRMLMLAEHLAMAGVALARDSKEAGALALPLYTYAQVQEASGKFDKALANYNQAIEVMEQTPPVRHSRPMVLVNIKIAKAVCEYKTGAGNGLSETEALVHELETSQEDVYIKDVWVSGGYMRLASALKEQDHDKAKEYLAKAQEIIESNPELSERRKQLEQLSASF